MNEKSVSVRNGNFQVDVLEGGSGNPLLYLHGIAGLEWTLFLDQLAEGHRVIAPRTPGFGGSTGTEQLLDIHDLNYFYLDLLDELGLDNLPIVGHSLGGMFAAELAAMQPARFSHVALAAPFGLWNDSDPIPDLFSISLPELATAMYADVKSEPAAALATAPQARMTEVDPSTEEGQATLNFLVERAKSMSTAAKYLWPIPNRGLSKRLHRVTQPAQIIWGQSDGIVPPGYAERFAAKMPNTAVHVVPNAAHMVVDEQPGHVAGLIEGLLAR
ncbi:MAG TPA: alpha/beta hydrolase [Dehalococcoidia bacterium]|jgi:pimeloyl-ACP methyl ester carboxylesterase|nr:hypothetical protein [Chloroflexota bacterium]MDP5877181.1 alpha/beta hydrolase [Dehalococcoidia bacterium]MDP7160520.1 alpha/beta hydrolase [Dehalococcoidia bacterium]MDP7213093.1 alpha/beta hydrolase [Dehalococcoidia bacterium]HCV28426.1 hypothetical protein [Dehalococcoidia bacterium]|tara:strand:+ start:461 stop:1276 length:816 start_codon:yes stop_codon:yes gene_type:complete